ncbi:MAG: class I SAM-dependent methyltransferase [Bacteroidota bacterium]
MIQTLTPTTWKDYELIDCGGFEKLERFGQYILRRPEPQAIWDKSLTEEEWNNQSHAYFKKDKGSQEKGEWILLKKIPDRWYIQYLLNNKPLKFKIAMSSFKHVGIFPEQAVNWDFIGEHTQPDYRVLNLFAYTGGASLAAKSAKADISHVDSVKQVISWAKDNMEASELDNIRWVFDDAMKYVQREVRREKKYNGIILDPPAYGRGPDGEKWILEEQINELLKQCKLLLDPENHYFILNLYSLGFSALIVENLIKTIFGKVKNLEIGELYIQDHFNIKLPLGVYCRFHS